MLVTTKDGVPVYHEVHPGNAADPALVEETMQSVRHLFPEIDRCMVVGDRAMLSEANVVALGELGFDHLLAAPMKRETWVREAIEATHDELMEKAEKAETETEEGEKVPDVITERETEDGRRVVVAYSMEIGQRQRRLRERRLDGVNDVAEDVVARLDGQKTGRGRPITDAGAFKQVLKAAIEKKSTAFYKIEMQGRDFIFEPLTEAMDYAETCDGKLAVVTDNDDLPMETLHRLYKDLQEIERSFRTIKSDLKIRPTYHWTEKRVRAHVLLCVIALTVERVMRLKLKKAQSSLSPPAALEELRRLMHVTITLPDGQRRHVLANRTPRQLDIFRDLDVPPLTKKRLAKLVV
jgi:transposase